MLAVLCSCVSPGSLADLVQSNQECSEKLFSSIPQLHTMTLMTTCCCLSPHFMQMLGFRSQTEKLVAFGCLWKAEEVVWGTNGWRTGHKSRYLAHVSSCLLGSRMIQGCLYLRVWQPCLTCPCLPGVTKRSHVMLRAPRWYGGESCSVVLSSCCRRQHGEEGSRQKDNSK